MPAPAAIAPTVSDFVRLCLRAQGDPTALAALRTAMANPALDWDAVQHLGLAQRLGPLIYQAVRHSGAVPPPVEQVLREAYHATAGRNLLLRHELAAALRALAAAGVSVIVLKGAALAEAVYRHIALRPMLDIDLLVHHADLSAAIRALAALGFAAPRIEMHAGTAATYESELKLRKPGLAEIELDLHWSLFDSPYYQHTLPMDWFWHTARPLHIEDTPALMLGANAGLLHLCGHLHLHHTGGELLWLHDVSQLIAFDQDRIDWDELLARTQAYDLVLPTQQVLSRVAADWGAPIPAAVLGRLRALQPSRTEVRTLTWLSRLTAAGKPVAPRLWIDLRSMPGWRQRFRFAATLLFPSATYMQERYRIRHPFLVPFYYPHRWLRGLRSAPWPMRRQGGDTAGRAERETRTDPQADRRSNATAQRG